MALSKITVNVGSSGLGRRALNKDKISGILFFNSSLPAGFSVGARNKKVYSLAEAEALGLAKSGTWDGEHYHVSEYFRMNPEGELWIGFYAVPGGAYDFTEISTMLFATNGEIRQLAVWANALTWVDTLIPTIQAIVDGLADSLKQVSILFACNMNAVTAVTGWSSIADLRTKTARKVTVIACESGSGQGLVLQTAKATSISAIGCALGAVSLAKVSQSIGNPANFNLSNGTEMEVLCMANGDLITALTPATLGAIKDKGYLIARYYQPDISGSYFERCPTAITLTNDFAFIENNRVVDKVIRGVRTTMTPQLNSSIAVKSDGTLTDDSVGYYQDLAQVILDQMVIDGEISAGKATVDPVQNIVSTSKLTVSVMIVPIGIAEEIVVNIGLTTSL